MLRTVVPESNEGTGRVFYEVHCTCGIDPIPFKEGLELGVAAGRWAANHQNAHERPQRCVVYRVDEQYTLRRTEVIG